MSLRKIEVLGSQEGRIVTGVIMVILVISGGGNPLHFAVYHPRMRPRNQHPGVLQESPGGHDGVSTGEGEYPLSIGSGSDVPIDHNRNDGTEGSRYPCPRLIVWDAVVQVGPTAAVKGYEIAPGVSEARREGHSFVDSIPQTNLA